MRYHHLKKVQGICEGPCGGAAFNYNNEETVMWTFVSLRPVWSTLKVPGQPVI